MTLQTPQLVPRDGGDHYHFLNHLMTTKVSAEQTDGALTAMEFVGPADSGHRFIDMTSRTNSSTSSRARCGSGAETPRLCTRLAPRSGCPEVMHTRSRSCLIKLGSFRSRHLGSSTGSSRPSGRRFPPSSYLTPQR